MLIVNKSRKLPITMAVVAAVAVIAAGAWFSSGSDQAEFDELQNSPTASPSAEAPRATASAGGASMFGQPLPSEPVEDPATVFELGHNGGLQVDGTTVSALDRLHTTLGENPTAADVSKMEAQLRAGLPAADAERAIRLLHGYRSYNRDTRTELMSLGIPQTRAAADQLLDRMASLQNRHFDPETAKAMFAEQNKVSRVVMDAALIQMDPALSDEQKKQALDTLRASLPPEQQSAVPEHVAEAASEAES